MKNIKKKLYLIMFTMYLKITETKFEVFKGHCKIWKNNSLKIKQQRESLGNKRPALRCPCHIIFEVILVSKSYSLWTMKMLTLWNEDSGSTSSQAVITVSITSTNSQLKTKKPGLGLEAHSCIPTCGRLRQEQSQF